jgi:hypothetical protein
MRVLDDVVQYRGHLGVRALDMGHYPQRVVDVRLAALVDLAFVRFAGYADRVIQYETHTCILPVPVRFGWTMRWTRC